ncbi:hypothetical protein psyc5s11_18770 [Clostridium gelidum]|uniref:ATPase AAA-type core domain-containing protein n=1 Tax=Clostridium gelidum TaxID=704125 RepID=A0ABM7TA36_9CLOT|nr:AAA family ATPase [Clostridium gelidum]BCZ45810.1 hypothetical protein psyc5s11_18770 [Clostridium gelidum]
MQLLYLWINDYKCFNKRGFNFSSKHRFEYDYESNIITYTQNEDYIEGFFNRDNSNEERLTELTAVVGKNGAGKSTLLEIIFKNIAQVNLENKFEGIACFLENENITIYYTMDSKQSETVYLNIEKKHIKYFNNYDVEYYLVEDNNKRLYWINHWECFYGENGIYQLNNYDLKNSCFIYHSNIFEEAHYENIRGSIKDISTKGLIRSDAYKKLSNHSIDVSAVDPNVVFFHEDFYRQIQFIYDYSNSDKYISFDLPKEVNVSFSDLRPVLERLYNKIDVNNFRDDFILNADNKINELAEKEKIEVNLAKNIWKVDNFFEKLIDDKSRIQGQEEVYAKKKFGVNLIKGIFTEFMSRIIQSTDGGNQDEQYKMVSINIKEGILKEFGKRQIQRNIKEINNTYEIFDVMYNFCGRILAEVSRMKILSIEQGEIKAYMKCISNFNKWLKLDMEKYMKYNHKYNHFIIKINKKSENEEFKYISNQLSLKEFYKSYRDTAKSFNYLEFSWGVSSGENNLISLFARFYSLIDGQTRRVKERDTIDDLIILIDEADITFHPEWQQKYIKSLLDFLHDIYANYRMQLIITTHSPIMLSDIPKSNVIFLPEAENNNNDKENNDTFGSNIYDLYRSGFYLEGSNFGIIGKFALEKIKKTEEKLNEILNGNNSFTIEDKKEELKKCRKLINIIGEKFIKGLLQEKYDQALSKLYMNSDKKSDSPKLDELKNEFERLSIEDQKSLIKYIIQRNER